MVTWLSIYNVFASGSAVLLTVYNEGPKSYEKKLKIVAAIITLTVIVSSIIIEYIK